ncbi:MAG: glycyl-radical enzyme activating protein [Clostridiaceae bacterium]|nr:glycyl-radical enzyme activating protein [Clostridiaceae bacterium]
MNTPASNEKNGRAGGLIFNIQRFSLQDGPGIRTTVFFKGCPLRCSWCHNPESQRNTPELQAFPDLCLHCGRCAAVCSQAACHQHPEGTAIDRRLCRNCGSCAAECPSGALILCGRYRTAESVIAEVVRDEPFYRQSGGGLTLSGGEPLLQPDFALELLLAAKEQGLHTAVDTSGYADWQQLAALIPWTDLWLYDLKSMNTARHQTATGVSNNLILENLRRLGQRSVPIHIRIPLIAGFNDSLEEMRRMSDFLRLLPAVRLVEFSPYHELAGAKYQSLGRPNPVFQSPAAGRLESLMMPFRTAGLAIRYLNE